MEGIIYNDLKRNFIYRVQEEGCDQTYLMWLNGAGVMTMRSLHYSVEPTVDPKWKIGKIIPLSLGKPCQICELRAREHDQNLPSANNRVNLNDGYLLVCADCKELFARM